MRIKKLNVSDQSSRRPIFTRNKFSNDFHQSRSKNVCAFKNDNNSTNRKFWVGGKIRTSQFWPILSHGVLSYLRLGQQNE